MIDTYIYGTPKGFDFYEADAQLHGYFRSFYVSARRDRRLMVNRRADGKTIYSFLCYNTCEVSEPNEAGRMHGFFGCSIVVDGYQYCADLSELFSWFEMLFNRLLSNKKLLFVNQANIVQYRCRNFSEQAEEVEWLKTQLPKIFTSTASNALRLSQYDSSFVDENAVRTVCCNINTPKPKVLSYLKKYRWFAISPSFEESQELNIYELRENLNSFTKQIARLSIEPSLERRESVLNRIFTSCDSSYRAIKDCIPTLFDHDDIQTYSALKNEFAELMTIVRSQLEDIARQKATRSNTNSTPETNTTANHDENSETNSNQNSRHGNSDFLQPRDGDRGNNGDNGSNGGTGGPGDSLPPRDISFCHRCRQHKDKRYFSKNPQICDSCLQAETSIFTRLFERLNAKSLFFIAAAITFLIVVVLWLFKPDPTPSVQQGDFDQYLYAHQYDNAWNCSREFPDKVSSMRRKIGDAIKKDIDSILMVDAMNVDNKKSIDDYFSRHKCVDSIRNIDRNKIKDCAIIVNKIKTALKQNNLRDSDLLGLSRNENYIIYWQNKIKNQIDFNNSLSVGNYAEAWRIANDDIVDLKDFRIDLIKRNIEDKLDAILTTDALNSRSVHSDVDYFLNGLAVPIDSLNIDRDRYLKYAEAIDSFKRDRSHEHLSLIPEQYQHYWRNLVQDSVVLPIITMTIKGIDGKEETRQFRANETITLPAGTMCIINSNVDMKVDSTPNNANIVPIPNRDVKRWRKLETKVGVKQTITAGNIEIIIECKSKVGQV